MNTLSRLLISAVFTVGAYSPVALGQTAEETTISPEKTIESYGDWSVRCEVREGLPPCDMIQVAMHNQTGRRMMFFSIAHAGDRENYGVRVIVPLGVLVSGGVLVRIDDETDVTDYKFTRCDVSGCLIESMVEPDGLVPFRRGIKGRLVVLDGQGKPIAIPLSFKGFTAAVDVMTSRNRDWAKNHERKS